MRFLFTTSLYTTHKQPRRLRENSNIGENIYPNNAELLFDMAAQWNIESERIAERGGKLNISSTLIKLCCLRLERDSEITSSLLLRTTTIIKCFNKSFQRTRIAHEMMDVPEIKEGFFLIRQLLHHFACYVRLFLFFPTRVWQQRNEC